MSSKTIKFEGGISITTFKKSDTVKDDKISKDNGDIAISKDTINIKDVDNNNKVIKEGKSNKKKSKGGKKANGSKLKLSLKDAQTASDDTAINSQTTTVQVTNTNNAKGVVAPLSTGKTAKNKAKAQEKADKKARAAQLAKAVPKAKETSPSGTAGSSSGAVNVTTSGTSKDATFKFGHGQDKCFEFSHGLSLKSGDASSSDSVSSGAIFSGSPTGDSAFTGFTSDDAASSGSEPATACSSSKSRRPSTTAFTKLIREQQQNPTKPHLVGGTKTPRNLVSVKAKANRKPLDASTKKDHGQQNALMLTINKNKENNVNCREVMGKYVAVNGVNVPRTSSKEPSQSLAITHDTSADVQSEVDEAAEADGVEDEDMPDAPLSLDAESMEDDAIATPVTDGNATAQIVDFVESSVDATELALALSDPDILAQQPDEQVTSGDDEDCESKEDQQGKSTVIQESFSHTNAVLEDEIANDDTANINEQTSSDDMAQDIVDESTKLLSYTAIQEAPLPAEEKLATKSELNFLSFPNAAEYPPVLSREAEQTVIEMHVTTLQLPTAAEKPSRAQKKASNKKAPSIDEDIVATVIAAKSELYFLSFPNAAEYPPILSREAQQFIVDTHVKPVQLPAPTQKPSHAQKDTSKARQVMVGTLDAPGDSSSEPAEVPVVKQSIFEITDTVELIADSAAEDTSLQLHDNVSEHGSDSSSESSSFHHSPALENIAAPLTVKEDTFVVDFLSLTNGPGHTLAARQFEEKLIAQHVAPLVFAPSEQPGKKTKASKKAQKAAEVAAPDTHSVDSELPDPAEIVCKDNLEAEPTAADANTLEITDDVSEAAGVSETLTDEVLPVSTSDNILPPLTSNIPPSPPSSSPSFSESAHNLTSNVEPATTNTTLSHLTVRPSLTIHVTEVAVIIPEDILPTSPNDIPPSPPSSYPSFSSSERSAIRLRNTHLGITSLEEFFGHLAISPTNTVTKLSLCQTFATFAAAEYETLLGERPTHLNTNFESIYTLCQTKMGKTTLFKFLKAVQWQGNVAPVSEVVRVFKKEAKRGVEFDKKVLGIARNLGEA